MRKFKIWESNNVFLLFLKVTWGTRVCNFAGQPFSVKMPKLLFGTDTDLSHYYQGKELSLGYRIGKPLYFQIPKFQRQMEKHQSFILRYELSFKPLKDSWKMQIGDRDYCGKRMSKRMVSNPVKGVSFFAKLPVKWSLF